MKKTVSIELATINIVLIRVKPLLVACYNRAACCVDRVISALTERVYLQEDFALDKIVASDQNRKRTV